MYFNDVSLFQSAYDTQNPLTNALLSPGTILDLSLQPDSIPHLGAHSLPLGFTVDFGEARLPAGYLKRVLDEVNKIAPNNTPVGLTFCFWGDNTLSQQDISYLIQKIQSHEFPVAFTLYISAVNLDRHRLFDALIDTLAVPQCPAWITFDFYNTPMQATSIAHIVKTLTTRKFPLGAHIKIGQQGTKEQQNIIKAACAAASEHPDVQGFFKNKDEVPVDIRMFLLPRSRSAIDARDFRTSKTSLSLLQLKLNIKSNTSSVNYVIVIETEDALPYLSQMLEHDQAPLEFTIQIESSDADALCSKAMEAVVKRYHTYQRSNPLTIHFERSDTDIQTVEIAGHAHCRKIDQLCSQLKQHLVELDRYQCKAIKMTDKRIRILYVTQLYESLCECRLSANHTLTDKALWDRVSEAIDTWEAQAVANRTVADVISTPSKWGLNLFTTSLNSTQTCIAALKNMCQKNISDVSPSHIIELDMNR